MGSEWILPNVCRFIYQVFPLPEIEFIRQSVKNYCLTTQECAIETFDSVINQIKLSMEKCSQSTIPSKLSSSTTSSTTSVSLESKNDTITWKDYEKDIRLLTSCVSERRRIHDYIKQLCEQFFEANGYRLVIPEHLETKGIAKSLSSLSRQSKPTTTKTTTTATTNTTATATATATEQLSLSLSLASSSSSSSLVSDTLPHVSNKNKFLREKSIVSTVYRVVPKSVAVTTEHTHDFLHCLFVITCFCFFTGMDDIGKAFCQFANPKACTRANLKPVQFSIPGLQTYGIRNDYQKKKREECMKAFSQLYFHGCNLYKTMNPTFT